MAADDVAQIRRVLKGREAAASDQTWADTRPWRANTHVWWENTLAVVDLHDLGASLARDVVRDVLALRPARGAVIFVHGRGRHTLGKTSVLRGVVHKELDIVCAEHRGMTYRMMGAGRTAWISDPDKAPRFVKGGFGLLTWLWLVAIAVAILFALGHAMGLW